MRGSETRNSRSGRGKDEGVRGRDEVRCEVQRRGIRVGTRQRRRVRGRDEGARVGDKGDKVGTRRRRGERGRNEAKTRRARSERGKDEANEVGTKDRLFNLKEKYW
jgi:hypothetical protein